MAYPTDSLRAVLEDIDRSMISLKNRADRDVAVLAAAPVRGALILDEFVWLRTARNKLSSAASTPGIVQYAKDQKNDQGLDVVAEFNAVIAAIDAATAWIDGNFPKDGQGYLLQNTLGVDGPLDRTFTPAATGPLQTHLTALSATIA